MRRFVGTDLGREPVPDETTVCRFRHLLEEHDLGRRLFDEVQQHVAAKGPKVATGTMVDVTIINARFRPRMPKARNPEMHQTKKGNQRYFGMKAHFEVDSLSKLFRAVVATPANVADSAVLPDLWQETHVRGDQGACIQGAGLHQSPIWPAWCGEREGVCDKPQQAQSRAKVEHPIGVSKRVFGLVKVRYHGLKENTQCLVVTCALANLFMARRHLLRSHGV